jgi:hypothetical protein
MVINYFCFILLHILPLYNENSIDLEIKETIISIETISLFNYCYVSYPQYWIIVLSVEG